MKRTMLLTLALLCPACGGPSHPPVYPVRGRVLYQGKPAKQALVVFHPVGGHAGAVKARGQVAEDGSFTLSTFGVGDGAPAGDYRVTVELWLSSGKGDEGPVSRLPARYGRPEQSGLTATVAAGPTELKPFQLRR